MKLEIGKSYGILLPDGEVLHFEFTGEDGLVKPITPTKDKGTLIAILREGYLAYWELKPKPESIL